jgi:hypothetical protein
VQEYSDAFLTGEVNRSWSLLSKRCRDRMGRDQWSRIVTAAAAQYGKGLPVRSFDATVSGDLARVSYTFDVAEINQDSEPWVREGGKWLEDDC